MKAIDIILTILFWLAIVTGIPQLIKTANSPMGGTLGGAFGSLLAFALIPSIIYGIRYLVRKNKGK
jgi:hypothetical protein